MASFDRVLAALSPALAGHSAGPCPLQVCLEASGAYAGTLAACLHTGKGRGQCEREALAEAVAETACMTRNLKELLAVIAPPVDASQRKAEVSRSIQSHR